LEDTRSEAVSDETSEQDKLDAIKDEAEDDFYSDENVQARREASGITFIAHDTEDNTKVSDGHPSNLLVGREGEKKTLRAEAFTDSGPKSELEVDAHKEPVAGDDSFTGSPGKFAGVNAREGKVIDLDKPVVGHTDEEGNVEASNTPAKTGEFVSDPDAVTEMAEANKLPEHDSGTDSQVAGH
jgi:hypothetical protein